MACRRHRLTQFVLICAVNVNRAVCVNLPFVLICAGAEAVMAVSLAMLFPVRLQLSFKAVVSWLVSVAY